MKPILFYDSETSGLPLFDQPSEDPRQPHIAQLAGILFDPLSRVAVAGFDYIVRPDGWQIEAEAAAVHGITTERALDEGVPEKQVIETLLGLWRQAALRVAHNESFDARIIRIGLKRMFTDELADEWKEAPAACTSRMAGPIMKLAPTAKMLAAGRRHQKTPKLTEAYEYFLGRPLENAHSAFADAAACRDVYFAIQDRGQPK